MGTFTAQPRGGRVWRIVKTVRYYPRIGAWVNKIGLRNPGIDWYAQKVQQKKIDTSDKIVSIHGFNDSEWFMLLDKLSALKPLAIELNMSCPNVGEMNWPVDLFTRACAQPVPIIVKLPPVNYDTLFTQAMEAGVRIYHCCNTLPVPSGGISGKPLKPAALQCIRRVRTELAGRLADALTLIGGGGITQRADLDDYRQAGADHFAIGTKVFNPVYLFTHRGLQPLIDHVQK